MLPKLKIGLTALGEKNKKQNKTKNKRTNELTNHKRENKNKQTNKQHRKTIPSSLAIVRSITSWKFGFIFFNVGYGAFGFLDHPLRPFYLMQWRNATPKYLWILLFNWNIHVVSLKFIRVSVRDGRNYRKQSMGPPGPPGKPGVRGKQDLPTALCRRYQLSTFCKV